MYELVTISGQENTVGIPVYIPTLNLEGSKIAGGSQEVIIPMAGVEGAEVIIAPNSVELPDGRSEGRIMFSQVQTDKVPMPPPNGMQPQFIVTIQPHGAKFDPPAELTLPNVDGNLPGAEIEMYSYDHDLEEFVTIGLGTVSKDGSIITSNVGSGVIKAGWHCGSGPGGSGCTHNCADYCDDCNAACNCVLNRSRKARTQTPNDCKTAYCGGGMRAANDPKEDIPADCTDPICVGKNHDTKPADETAELEAKNGNKCQYCESGSIKNLKIDELRLEANGKEILDIDYDGEPVSVNFTSEARSYLGDCEIKYLWDFGDGNDSTSQNPTHSYEKPGKYVTTLKVSCEGCEQATKSGSVTVNVNPVKVDLIDVTIESKEVLKITYQVETGRVLKSAEFKFLDEVTEISNKTGVFEVVVNPQFVEDINDDFIPVIDTGETASLTFNDGEDSIPVTIARREFSLTEKDVVLGAKLFTGQPAITSIKFIDHIVTERYGLIRTSSEQGIETHVTTERSAASIHTQVNNVSNVLLIPKFISLWGEFHWFHSLGLGIHDKALMQKTTGPGLIAGHPPGDDIKYKELVSNRTHDSTQVIISGTFKLDSLFMTDSVTNSIGIAAFPITPDVIEINFKLE